MKFLVIQTAFIGDVILATSIVEKLHELYPNAKIDFLLRKGNESLLEGHPFINDLIIWDKKNRKYINFIKIIRQVRKNKYDYVINIQRFLSSGLITVLSGAKQKIGFKKNPLSFMFTQSVKHIIGDVNNIVHEVNRNLNLIEKISKPANEQIRKSVKLYPSTKDYEFVKQYKKDDYICIAPASVWFTKQYPKEKWEDFIKQLSIINYQLSIIYLLGSKNDYGICQDIKMNVNPEKQIVNLAGELNFLQTAALMKDARMNYVNDSAPLHIASSVNAPVTAVFCSTIPAFGFGPLSDKSFIVELQEKLYCRPCGLHGFSECPEKHFRCALEIKTEQLLGSLRYSEY